VVVTPDGYVDVAVVDYRSPSFDIAHARFDGDTWSAWKDLGAPAGQPVTSPAIASGAAGQVDIVMLSADFSVHHVRGDGTTFGGWQSLNITAYNDPYTPQPYNVAPPTAVAVDANTLEVFVQGSDTHLWRNELWGGSWNGWEQIAGCARPGAAAAAIARNATSSSCSGHWRKTTWCLTPPSAARLGRALGFRRVVESERMPAASACPVEPAAAQGWSARRARTTLANALPAAAAVASAAPVPRSCQAGTTCQGNTCVVCGAAGRGLLRQLVQQRPYLPVQQMLAATLRRTNQACCAG
jgi:hypothetical protein